MLFQPFHRTAALACLLGLGAAATAAGFTSPAEQARLSVVKIFATTQRADYAMPWQNGRPSGGTGTGFFIGKRRILTNAHVVSDARMLEVQKDGDPERYEARVRFIGHDCDLAVLTVDNPAFFEGTRSVAFSRALPQLNDEVSVFGYPMGGDLLSVTRGVVSRIDYSVYSHSGVDLHLVLQVDAAINPGNSGGPVIQNGRVVGLAFQALSVGENIGYAIPLPVISRFLADIEDGRYDGYPELGVQPFEIRNPALRADLGLPPGKTGIAVSRVDPFASARSHLRPRDVLLTIDGHPIASDGSVALAGNQVTFSELLERKQVGEAVVFSVWRDRTEQTISVPLGPVQDPFIFRNAYDVRPRYSLYAGYVFTPLGREYLRTLDLGRLQTNERQLFYCLAYAKDDNLHTNRDEFVVLTRRLPHPVNSHSDAFLNGVVESVDGAPVRNLRDLSGKLAAGGVPFHIVRFMSMDDFLVIDVPEAIAANRQVARKYGILETEYLGEDQ